MIPGESLISIASAWLLDVDGRAGDVREVPAPREDLRREEQHAGPDQVGADGVPRQSGVRLELLPIDFALFA
jgi:hypothetical protein